MQAYLGRAMRAGKEDLGERTPALRGLSDRTIAEFGVGALGAPAALELARSGIGVLRVVDHDFVDAGTIVRWPLGVSAIGLPKVEAIKGFVTGNYPYTSIQDFQIRIGAPRMNREDVKSQLDDLRQILNGADLIYDATAEPGVWYALSELARELSIPYVYTWATPGAWGGVVARIMPGGDGCWLCLEHHFADGTISTPNADPAGTIQPAGCADPTFTGTSFDLNRITLAGVRLAISTLSVDVGEYPVCPWDVAVIQLRDVDGNPSETVETYELQAHPDCPRCGG
jgi:molybdopterin/thiamine biosynthesis adenylyltransferase